MTDLTKELDGIRGRLDSTEEIDSYAHIDEIFKQQKSDIDCMERTLRLVERYLRGDISNEEMGFDFGDGTYWAEADEWLLKKITEIMKGAS